MYQVKTLHDLIERTGKKLIWEYLSTRDSFNARLLPNTPIELLPVLERFHVIDGILLDSWTRIQFREKENFCDLSKTRVIALFRDLKRVWKEHRITVRITGTHQGELLEISFRLEPEK